MGSIRIGTCGFAMRQKEYFNAFPVIEIQRTFYQPPQLKTVERWRQDAPDEFEFTVKAFQAITHHGSSPTYRRSNLNHVERAECGGFRDTRMVREAWRMTLQVAKVLDASFVIFQCPSRFTPTEGNVENMKQFFESLERDGMHLGFEPRGEQWSQKTVHDLCRDLDLVHVVDPLQDRPVYGTPRYFRMHGNGNVAEPKGYSHEYTDEELVQLRERCTARRTYCLFNNVTMREDAERFRALTDQGRE